MGEVEKLRAELDAMTDSKMPDRRPSLTWIIENTSQVRVRDLALEIFNDLDAHIRADLTHPAPAPDAELEALVEKAEAVVDRWDSPNWAGSEANSRHTRDYINDLRKAISALRARTAQPVGVQDAAKVLLDSLSLRTIGQDHPQITPEMTIAASMFLSALMPEGCA